MVGLGSMGMPIARRLRDAGYAVNVFARRAEVRDEAQAFGAAAVESLGALADSSDVVIVNVFSDDQVREVTIGDAGLVAQLRPDTVLVNHSTGRPATMREVGVVARERGAHVLDAAMSGGPNDIAHARLVLLVGGDATVLEDVRPLLSIYSAPILHVGAVGDGQQVKLLNNALFGAQVALAVRIEQGARDLGMDPALVLPAIHACSGDSYALNTAVMIGSATQLLEAARRYIEKDVAVCAEVAAELGVDLGSVLTVAREIGED